MKFPLDEPQGKGDWFPIWLTASDVRAEEEIKGTQLGGCAGGWGLGLSSQVPSVGTALRPGWIPGAGEALWKGGGGGMEGNRGRGNPSSGMIRLSLSFVWRSGQGWATPKGGNSCIDLCWWRGRCSWRDWQALLGCCTEARSCSGDLWSALLL